MEFEFWLAVGADAPVRRVRRMQITTASLNGVSSFAGSYHILEMGRHFADYYARPRRLALPVSSSPIPSFPPNIPFVPLKDKTRSPGVTANIGEALAGLIGRREFGLGPRRVVHIVPASGNVKCPDFMFRFDPVPRSFYGMLRRGGYSSASLRAAPVWWPVEAKARGEDGEKDGFEKALIQLSAYWWKMAETQSNLTEMGYGLIANCLADNAPPVIRVHLLIPKDQSRVTRYFAAAVRRTNGNYLSFIRCFRNAGKRRVHLDRLMRLFYGS